MRVLLDTHVFLWFLSEEQLSPQTLLWLRDPARELTISIASGWEIAIKSASGKLVLDEPALVWMPEALRASGIEVLPLTMNDVLVAGSLPPHHHDPFDRLIVAQALGHGRTLCTRDRRLERYSAPVHWV